MGRGLSELLDAPKKPPKFDGWEQSATSEWDGETGFIQTGQLSEEPKSWDQFIIDAGLDPNEVEVVGNVQVRGWDSIKREGDESNVVRMHYYKITVRRKQAHLPDLQQLLASARAARPHTPVGYENDSAMVVCLSDTQLGKVGSRGGTEEVLKRVDYYLEQIELLSKLWRCKSAALLDPGDIIEGIESGGGLEAQLSTNDLSLPDQVELASVVEFEFMKALAKTHDDVTVASVPSNHCRLRRGKTNLGVPSDDWGLHAARQVHHRIQDNPEKFGHVKMILPETYEESLSFDIAGQRIGMAHGHQSGSPDRVPDWWAKQVHGGKPIASATILVTGHFHSFRCQPSGRHPVTGREKWWLQCPTLDNGSDWFSNKSGSDSEASLLVFRVDNQGWHDLTLLKSPSDWK